MMDTAELRQALEQGRSLIDGPAGALELLVEAPKSSDTRGIALIAHPHPLHGGTMDNKVVYSVARGAQDAGCLAVRFNFRGVGRSVGQHAHGPGEQEDLAAVAAYLREALPKLPVALAGFSFGSYQALAQCAPVQAKGVLTVAPPLAYAGDEPLPDPQAPWWLIHGDADDVVDCADTLSRAKAAVRPPEQLQVLPGVGHFFHGELPAVRSFTEDFLRAVI